MNEYRIINKGTGKWLLQFRATKRHNWGFIAEGKTPLKAIMNL